MPRRGRTDEGRSTIAAARLAAIVAPSASRALPSDEVESARENGRHEAASAARRPPPAAEIGQPQGSVDHLDFAGVRFTELAFAFGRRHFGVLAVLLALGLVLTGWMFLRARPVADASPL